jgi:hypothetical protein
VAAFRSDRRAKAVAALAVVVLGASAQARAADNPNDPLQRARTEFVSATEHVKNARWGEALAAFERSFELRPHALTLFNIAACERALGRYTRARASFLRALEANEATNNRELAPSFVADAKKWSEEIDKLLVRASIEVRPSDAALLVDGAPLGAGAKDGEYVAGLAPSEKHAPPPKGPFTVVFDPGVHIFSLSRPGFANALVTKTVTPGSTPSIVLDLESLPATIHIASNRPGSVVTIDALDVGLAPTQVTRPAGVYLVAVRKPGYVPYETNVKVGPGESPTLQATLAEEKQPITKKVWFWAALAAVVAGAATVTYFIVRPEPQRPPPDGGGLGWVVTLPGTSR